MALTDLRVSYQGAGATLYAIVRNASTYTVWNGSSFETWANGNIATYDIALTDQGGDEYATAFPSAITAGNYIVDYYEQAGATPAITDLRLTGELVYWSGTALSDTSSVTLNQYALTTLTGVKRHLNISVSTYDTKLTDLINQVSAQIERITGMKFKARDYRQRYNGFGQRALVLRARPVQTINRIVYGLGNAMTLTYTGSAIRASASVYVDPELYEGGGVKLVTIASNGTRTSNSLSFASYASLSSLETAIEAVSGWSATVLVNMPSLDLHPTGGEDALNRTVYFTYPDQDESRYSVDYLRGIVQFDYRQDRLWRDTWGGQDFCAGHQEILCEYRGGYETIPDDVELLCREMVKEIYLSSTENTAVNSYTLGPYSVTFSQEQHERVQSKLAPYMDYANLIGGAA